MKNLPTDVLKECKKNETFIHVQIRKHKQTKTNSRTLYVLNCKDNCKYNLKREENYLTYTHEWLSNDAFSSPAEVMVAVK